MSNSASVVLLSLPLSQADIDVPPPALSVPYPCFSQPGICTCSIWGKGSVLGGVGWRQGGGKEEVFKKYDLENDSPSPSNGLSEPNLSVPVSRHHVPSICPGTADAKACGRRSKPAPGGWGEHGEGADAALLRPCHFYGGCFFPRPRGFPGG